MKPIALDYKRILCKEAGRMEIETQLSRSTYMKILGLLVLRRWYFYVYLLIAVFFFWMGLGKTSFLIGAFIFLIFLILVIPLSILLAGLSSKNRNFFLPVKWVFTDEMITCTSPIGAETLKWEAFIKWKRLSKYYLLYVSSNNFISISKSSIPEQDVPKFETMLSMNINK